VSILGGHTKGSDGSSCRDTVGLCGCHRDTTRGSLNENKNKDSNETNLKELFHFLPFYIF
jgi:hypothetical protein